MYEYKNEVSRPEGYWQIERIEAALPILRKTVLEIMDLRVKANHLKCKQKRSTFFKLYYLIQRNSVLEKLDRKRRH